MQQGADPSVSDAKLAWEGESAAASRYNFRLCLYKDTWTNPLPDKTMKSMKLVSAQKMPVPFLLAITTE